MRVLHRRSAAITVAALATLALGGCSRTPAPPAETGRVGYCVGVDASHPKDSQATVTFKRGDVVLGSIGNVVQGSGSMPVTPGTVTVYVDDVLAATMTVSDGAVAYASQGKGCPASLP